MPSCWLALGIAVFTEIIWALSLKYIHLHPNPWLIAGAFALSCVNMGLLSLAMRGIPAGTAYAIWTGLGAVGVTLGGAYWFKDPVRPMRLACMGLIAVGVVGLKLVAKG